MKKYLALLMLLSIFLLPSTASAQTYEGTDLEDGIFYVPADPGPNSVINFAATGLMPNSDVSFILLDADQNEVDGLAVAGAVVLRADAGGNFNGDLRLPSNVEAGTLTLRIEATRADDSPLVAELAVVITEDAVANPGGTDVQPSDLAYTGSDSSTMIFGGFLLVVAGIALVVVATQRHTRANDA